MRAEDIDLHEFFTSGRNYIIPVYQRNYDWKKENCQKLLQDIIKAETDDLPEYFLGSIVITLKGKFNYNEYFIIDGQQRLTTITLLLLAIYHNDSEVAKGSRPNVERLIFYNIQDKEKRLILKQIQKDDEFLSKIIKEDEITDDNSNIINNYLYFQNEITNNPAIIPIIMSGFNRLRIVQISLNEKNDNPQLVFETLNATGKGLSEADKIRNYILMYKNQEKLYEDYWVKIEENCLQKYNENNVSAFIKCFLTVEYINKINTPIKDDKVYTVFKEYLENRDNEEILKLMLDYSKNYNLILSPTEDSKDIIVASIHRIRKNLNVTVLDSLLLYILKQNQDKNISNDGTFQMIFLLENYLIRRAICSITNNGLNTIVVSIIKKIVNQSAEEKTKETLEKLLFLKGNGLSLTNESIIESLKTKKLYNSNTRVLGYFLLKQLETLNNKEKNSFEGISIEHIMPRTLTDQWKIELGDEHQLVYDTYLHTLGNITLTGYNSELSNKPFDYKKMEILKTSKFVFLNKEISTVPNWTKEAILERTHRLANALLEMYPYPKNLNVEYKDNIGNINITEDIDCDFSSKEILEYEYNGKNYQVSDKNWSSFMVELLGKIYEEDTVKFNARIIENSSFSDKIKHECFDKEYIHNKCYNAGNGKVLYFNTVQDTNSKIRLIISIIEILEIDTSIIIKINY